MTRRFHRTMPLLTVMAAMAATTAGAQEHRQAGEPSAPTSAAVTADSAIAASRIASGGPTFARAAAGIRGVRAETAPPVAPPQPAETRENKAMMVVGAAGLIVGAIIGDTAGTLIMVGSAVLGLFGLYKYLE